MAKMKDCITIKGARENNLKNIDLTVPRDKLIVFTGLSGSGKSSLAFETIFAEGQRRYVESLSTYARQFLGQMDKPDVDYIEGLSPAVSIDQKSTSNNPRSTVGTVTEIYDYLRLFFARVGVPHCPKCGREIARQSIDQVVDKVKLLPLRSRILIVAPVIRAKKGEHVKLLEQIRKDGYVRVKIDGTVYDINDVPKLDKKLKHSIDVAIDVLLSRKALIQDLPIRWKQHLRSATGSQRLISCPTGMRQRRIFPLKKRPQTGESSLRTVWRSCFFLRILPVMSAVSALKKCHRECFLVQQSVRRLPGLHRPWLSGKNRSAACCSG